VVVDDEEEAARLVAEGHDVVLLVDGEAPPVGPVPAGRGRFALFVGSPSDPGAWEGARAMARELFGSD
jgi:hypothetical protein